MILPKRTRKSAWILAAAAIAGGCSGDAGALPSSAVVRDSAGVSIVENSAAAPPALRIGSQPIIEIGEMEGAAEYQLHDVQHATRLADGTIVIANNGSAELRFYDAAGRHLRSTGRRGGGPGEFQNISYMRRLNGDTLLIYDSRNRRITLVDGGGSYIRDFTPAAPGAEPVRRVESATTDGALLVAGSGTFPAASVTYHRDTMKFSVLRGDTLIPLPPYNGREATIRMEGSAGRIVSVSISGVAFARSTHVTAGADRIYVGTSDTYEIHAYDSEGTLRQIIRSAHVPAQDVTTELFERYAEARLERAARTSAERGETFDEAAARRSIAETPRSPAVPLYADVLADQEGGVWVKDYVLPGAEGEPERWTVFSADGRIRGAVDMPPRFRPMHIRADTITGVITDEYDVEYVRVYSISD